MASTQYKSDDLVANSSTHASITHVAIAVIYHQQKYLLAYRHSTQHQGDKFEFIGGKIEAQETAKQALIREVQEEVGLTLYNEQLKHSGNITHDYGDKKVCLHVYKAALSISQYAPFAEVKQGQEGQPLIWVKKTALLSGKYVLPEANLQILQWLKTDD